MSDVTKISSKEVARVESLSESDEKVLAKLTAAAEAGELEVDLKRVMARAAFGKTFSPMMRGLVAEGSLFGYELLRRELEILNGIIDRAKSARVVVQLSKAINDTLRTQALLQESCLKSAEIGGLVADAEDKVAQRRAITVNTSATYIGMPNAPAAKPIPLPPPKDGEAGAG